MKRSQDKKFLAMTETHDAGVETTTLLGKKGEIGAAKKQIDAAYKRICGVGPKRHRFNYSK